ncbi:MAG TPA: hypothetical protein VNO55_00965, partial [Polyangia bacterium]|nr:hypothetical protein [Polyangia bacterium]
VLAIFLVAGCGDPPAAGGGGASAAGAGGSGGGVTPASGSGGSAATGIGSSGGSAGTASDAAIPGGGTGGSSNGTGDASNTGAADASSVDGSGVEPHDFVCSELIGLWVASQWWGAFEKGVDNARWQFMFQHHGYLELFADPESPFWKNPIASACAAQSTTPDRVIFLPFSLTLMTMEDWHAQLTKLVDTMKQKFVGVRRIELLSTLRSPGNMLCPNDKDPGTIVPGYVDQAIAAVAAESGGLVTVGPKIELPDCSWWAGGTDLTGAGNTGVGQLMAAYYQAHP